MIISSAYTKKLIKLGKAKITTALQPDNNGRIYIAIDRYDMARVDHFEAPQPTEKRNKR